jgi:hypothetical protein
MTWLFKRAESPERWFARPGAGFATESQHYRVGNIFETVYLFRDAARPVQIGDFYGDLVAVAISSDERWCVMVGAGLIAYRLAEPFRPYGYANTGRRWRRGKPTDESEQWWEWERYPPEVKWLSSVVALDGDRFQVMQDQEGYPDTVDITPRVFIVHADERRVEEVPG